MANVPSYTVSNLSIGPGIIYIGLAGSTPSHDVGAISEDGMEFNLTQEYLEVYQGSPKTLIAQFKTAENLEITATGLEWNLIDLALALGAGVTTSSGTQDTFSFGGDPDSDAVALKIQHTMPSGHTLSFYVWRAQVSGEWTLKMAQDTLHTFPYTFKGVVCTLTWSNDALPVGQQLFRVVRQKA